MRLIKTIFSLLASTQIVLPVASQSFGPIRLTDNYKLSFNFKLLKDDFEGGDDMYKHITIARAINAEFGKPNTDATRYPALFYYPKYKYLHLASAECDATDLSTQQKWFDHNNNNDARSWPYGRTEINKDQVYSISVERSGATIIFGIDGDYNTFTLENYGCTDGREVELKFFDFDFNDPWAISDKWAEVWNVNYRETYPTKKIKLGHSYKLSFDFKLLKNDFDGGDDMYKHITIARAVNAENGRPNTDATRYPALFYYTKYRYLHLAVANCDATDLSKQQKWFDHNDNNDARSWPYGRTEINEDQVYSISIERSGEKIIFGIDGDYNTITLGNFGCQDGREVELKFFDFDFNDPWAISDRWAEVDNIQYE